MEAVTRRVVLAAAVLVAALAPASASAGTIQVTTESDAWGYDGACSLREAINSANHDYASDEDGGCTAGHGADLILLGEGFYLMAIGPRHAHGPGEELNFFGDYGIESAITIRGAGWQKTTVAGGALDRVFIVGANGTAVFEDLTISGGRTERGADGSRGPDGADGTGAGAGEPSVSGDGADSGGGGGIFNAGTTTIRDAVITGNSTGHGGDGGRSGRAGTGGPAGGAGGDATGGDGGDSGPGGGVLNVGTLTIERTTLRGNSTGYGGAGGEGGDEDGSGGMGGSSASGPGGDGGDAVGGAGGNAGGGGAVASLGPSSSLTIIDSRVASNATRDGGGGGRATAGSGGDGGSACAGCSAAGGAGGDALAGDAGDGGPGGGILAAGPASIARTTVTNNVGGGGGSSLNGRAGGGGEGAGPGGTGGAGGEGRTGRGGLGGAGGISSSAVLTLTASTIDRNSGGPGGWSGIAIGGSGGEGTNGGDGGDAVGGDAGGGGTGGLHATGAATAVNDTVTLNTAGYAGNAFPQVAPDGRNGSGGSGGDGGDATAGEGAAGGDGGVRAGPGTSLTHLTVSGNSRGVGSMGVSATAGEGGAGTVAGTPGTAAHGSHGIHGVGGVSGAATLRNSIVTTPAFSQGCAGSPADGGGNISFPEETCPGTHADPLLGPLGDNGGPTRTHALGPGSPAIDLVPARGAGCADRDQRGVTRPQRAACDAGAYEDAPQSEVPGPGPQPPGSPGPQPPVTDDTRPVLGGVRVTPPVFAVGQLTRFRFTLSEPARVTISIARRTRFYGGGVCRKPPCVRYVSVGRLVRSRPAGRSSIRFRGRFGKRRLARGRYRAVLRATDAAGNRSRAVVRSFRIVRR